MWEMLSMRVFTVMFWIFLSIIAYIMMLTKKDSWYGKLSLFCLALPAALLLATHVRGTWWLFAY